MSISHGGVVEVVTVVQINGGVYRKHNTEGALERVAVISDKRL